MIYRTGSYIQGYKFRAIQILSLNIIILRAVFSLSSNTRVWHLVLHVGLGVVCVCYEPFNDKFSCFAATDEKSEIKNTKHLEMFHPYGSMRRSSHITTTITRVYIETT